MKLITTVRDFLGMDLPPRIWNLQFNQPVISDKFEVDVDEAAFNADLEEYKNIPEKYFQVIVEGIKHLNHCDISPRHRRNLNADILQIYYPAAIAQMSKLSKVGGIPEPAGYKSILLAITEIAQTLIVSYQTLFAHYYDGSNYQYAHAQESVLEYASRIFELFLLKQQAKGLHYQLLEASDWEVINTLFYVLFQYEAVNQPLATLKKTLNVGHRHHELSLQDQFVLLHAVAHFDVLAWPTHIQWVMPSYVRSIEDAIVVHADTGHLGKHDLIVYCHGRRPAAAQRVSDASDGALILDCHGWLDAVRKDCLGMMRAKTRHDITAILPRFAGLPEAEHFVIFDRLSRGFHPQHGQRDQQQVVEDLRIFVGFADVFSLLAHRQSIFAAEDRLVDLLARRSALLAEDHAATEKSIWTLVFQHEQMLRLSTQETPFTTAMRIGSLLACGLGENINRPSLAVVTRIYRPRPKVVEIDIQRIANYAEPVMLSVNQPLDKTISADQRKSALLVYDHQHPQKWGLLFPPCDLDLTVDHVALHRKGHAAPLQLHGMRNATNDFYLFASALNSEQLGFTGEPDYPTPPAKKHHAVGWLL